MDGKLAVRYVDAHALNIIKVLHVVQTLVLEKDKLPLYKPLKYSALHQ